MKPCLRITSKLHTFHGIMFSMVLCAPFLLLQKIIQWAAFLFRHSFWWIQWPAAYRKSAAIDVWYWWPCFPSQYPEVSIHRTLKYASLCGKGCRPLRNTCNKHCRHARISGTYSRFHFYLFISTFHLYPNCWRLWFPPIGYARYDIWHLDFSQTCPMPTPCAVNFGYSQIRDSCPDPQNSNTYTSYYIWRNIFHLASTLSAASNFSATSRAENVSMKLQSKIPSQKLYSTKSYDILHPESPGKDK